MNRSRFGCYVVALSLAATGVSAQAPGTLTGIVKEDSSGRPVRAAIVAVEALKRQTTTDADGRFRLTDVAAGVRMVTVRRLGYLPAGLMVQFLPNETVEKTISVSPNPAELDTVKVADVRPRRLTGSDAFEYRRSLGQGRFLDSTDLRKLPDFKVSDVLATENGINIARPPKTIPVCALTARMVNCVSNTSMRVAMSRGLCAMKVMLDGQVLGVGGEVDSHEPDAKGQPPVDPRHNWFKVFDIGSIAIGSLVRMEIYRRPTEIPSEYQSSDTECGLILLWSGNR